MNYNKLVSVAMATYNGEKFLKKQLDSIFTQTYKNLEVIVVDDGSVDGTPKILEEYSKKFNLRYIVNKTNMGVAKAFEKAISLCRGDYIALADQDDIWEKEKIEKLVNAIGNNLIIYSDACLIDENDLLIAESYSNFTKKITIPSSLVELYFNGVVSGCTLLFKRDLLQYILPFPDNLYVHDKWIAIVAFLLERKIRFLEEPLVRYRQHNNNQIGAQKFSNNFSIRKFKDFFFNQSSKYKLRESLINQYNFLKSFKERFINELNLYEKFILDLGISYYADRLNSRISIKAFLINLLLLKYFDKNKPLTVKIKNLIKSLKGVK